VVFNLGSQHPEGREPFLERSQVDVSLDWGRWLIVGCYNGLRSKKMCKTSRLDGF